MELLLNYYRYVKCYFSKTKRERNFDTVELFLCEITFLSVQLKDHLYQATNNITHLLLHWPSSTIPSFEASDLTRNTILKLTQLLKRVEKILVFKISNYILSPKVKKQVQYYL